MELLEPFLRRTVSIFAVIVATSIISGGKARLLYTAAFSPQSKFELKDAVWICYRSRTATGNSPQSNFGPVNSWNVSSITAMPWIFEEASSFNQDISKWDVSQVTDMTGMFFKASSFNGKISAWDVSTLTDASHMFLKASSFNQDISQWDTSHVTDMFMMFSKATAFNQKLSKWNVTSVEHMSLMFEGATAFNQDISQWDTSRVRDMSGTFHDAKAFNQDISGWNVMSVYDMSEMFDGATAFNYALCGDWARSEAKQERMFVDSQGSICSTEKTAVITMPVGIIAIATSDVELVILLLVVVVTGVVVSKKNLKRFRSLEHTNERLRNVSKDQNYSTFV